MAQAQRSSTNQLAGRAGSVHGLPLQLDELQQVIQNAGGSSNALAYAGSLLGKIRRLEGTGRYRALMHQLRAARQGGDLRGRVLEVNFAEQFERCGRGLTYGAKQGMSGDIDFRLGLEGHDIFIEMKLLQQDQATKNGIHAQLKRTGVSSTVVTDDTRDVGRIQLDLMQKASTRKFNPAPNARWINLVAIDVAELLLGTVDEGDCFLATGGNPLVRRWCHEMLLRPHVVGVFEAPAALTPAQRQWLSTIQRLPAGVPHPRDYIHGALFLFREPRETSALAYDLSSILVWNPRLVTNDIALAIQQALHQVIPPARL